MEYSRSSVLVNASHGCASSVLRAEQHAVALQRARQVEAMAS